MNDPQNAACGPAINEGDRQMGLCLDKVQVPPVDTRDAMGRPRFFPGNLQYYTYPGLPNLTSTTFVTFYSKGLTVNGNR